MTLERFSLMTQCEFSAVRQEMADEFTAVRKEMKDEFIVVRKDQAAYDALRIRTDDTLLDHEERLRKVEQKTA